MWFIHILCIIYSVWYYAYIFYRYVLNILRTNTVIPYRDMISYYREMIRCRDKTLQGCDTTGT